MVGIYVYTQHIPLNGAPRLGYFWPQAYSLNDPGSGSLDKTKYKVSNTWTLLVSGKKIFEVFPIWLLSQTNDPRAGLFFTKGL